MVTTDATEALPPLDDLHRKARAAYVARDLDTYMDILSRDLRYRQPDGRVICRDQLARDVQTQFRRVSVDDVTYRTDEVDAVPEQVIETVTQWGWIAATAFGFLHRLWRLERQGRYTWRQTERGWKIFEVTVLRECVTGSGFQLGRRSRLPSLASIQPVERCTARDD